ncbi:MAG: hypothetical protein AUJ52_13720 [Elusimicrobia bacterium CG1_02_63_36]|nr:MAG: hypothetical protein AUJ52_13720 [Elusimicrobia bacterium CG1_02_63_36]
MRRLVFLLPLLLAGCAGFARRAEHAAKITALRERVAQGRYAEVVAELPVASIADLPRKNRAEAYLLLGRSLRLSGEVAAALQVFQLAEGLYPKNLNIITELATVLHGTGLDDRARPYYERVLKIHPNNAVSNNGIAEIYRTQGNLAASQRHFERALQEEGWDKNPWIWLNYGEVLAARRRYDAGAAALQKSVSIAESTDSLLALARVQRIRGRVEDARKNLATAILHNPSREDAILQRALWELKDGELDAARASAELVLSGDSRHALARWIRASVYLRRKEPELASADLAVAAAAERSDPFTSKVARAMLERLMGNP